MEPNAKFILGLAIFALVILAIGGYAYLKSREFLRGPRIAITSPSDGSVFSESLVNIVGIAENVAYITLNDGTIFVDSKGNFSEKLLLLPGYNIITVKVQDRFGKKVEKSLELVYQPATTTASSAPSN